MFIASKLLAFFTQPLAWVVLLLMGGVLGLRFQRKGGATLCGLALIVLLLQAWEPLPDVLLRRLETQYSGPASQTDLQPYAGVVILGGALEPAPIWQSHGQVALNDAAERMTVPLALLRQQPHLKLLFTGGEGRLGASGWTEAERARFFFDSMGVPSGQVIYESASRNTYENAYFSARLPGVDPNLPWLLLTSAAHIPRAMATFRKAGWNVTPYPVDFLTGESTSWSEFSLVRGADKWNKVLHELVGLLVYRLAGQA